MTVIAYDGKYLVADGRSTRGTSLVTENQQKLHQLTIKGLGKCVIGVCGALDVLGPWLAHLREDGLGEQLEQALIKDEDGPLEMRGILITEKNKCYEITTSGGFFEITTPQAIGSGCWVAQHFLATGYDAVTAVKEACKTELTCGGQITVYDISKKTFSTI